MPTAFNIYKVTSFPGSPQADAIYIKKEGTRAVIKVTDSSGVYMSNEQGLVDVLGISNVAASDLELIGAGGGTSLLVNAAAGSYGLGDVDAVNGGVALIINDAVSKAFLKGIGNGVGNGILTIASDGQVQQRTFAQIVSDLGITPIAATNGQVVYMDASDDPVGSADLTFDGTTLKVSKTSGAPGIMTQRGSSIYGRFIIPTSNLSYTGTTIKDMPVLFGYCDDGIAIASARPSDGYGNAIIVKGSPNDGIEFWAGLGMKLKLDNTGVIMPSLATWGGNKLLTVGYGGEVGSVDVPITSNGAFTGVVNNMSNVSSVTVSGTKYMRVVDMVHCAAGASVTTSAAGAASFEVEIPVASTLNSTRLFGSMTGKDGLTGIIIASGSGNRARVEFNAPAAGTYSVVVMFQYEVA